MRPDRNRSTEPFEMVKMTRNSASPGSLGTKMRSTVPSSLTVRSSWSPNRSVTTSSRVPIPIPDLVVTDPASMERAAEAIAGLGPKNVLVKGGHLHDDALDVLWSGGQIYRFPSERVDTKHTHGTGCVFSAAITARLARGEELTSAIAKAKAFVTEAIRTNPGLGSGFGPTNLRAET